MVKQFIDGTLSRTSTPVRVDLDVMAMKRYSTFPKLLGWILAIRWFSVISRILIGRGEVLPLCRDSANVFYSPIRLGCKYLLG